MAQRRSFGLALSALFAAVLLAGCTAQGEPAAEDPPPTSSTTQTSTPLGNAVSGTYTGTHTIELGAPPEEATHIRVELTCLSSGTIHLPGDAEVTCGEGAVTAAFSSLPLTPGQESIEVKTSEPTVSYEATVVYENGASVK